MMNNDKINAAINPEGSLEVLSQLEVNALLDTSSSGLYQVYRQCSLAVLNCGSDCDNAHEIFEAHQDFEINLIPRDRGIKLEVKNAPASAFVDGSMIKGIREHLFAVLRDILYLHSEILNGYKFDLEISSHITSAVFHILRNAGTLTSGSLPNVIVCWGGHSINRREYNYSKEVGYQFGLRGLDVCTGCGPGAMKGPMKGATIGHAKQRISTGRYIGISEPGIIAAESPNPIVNELIIMPDIEKRLEAFVRTAHGVVIFPGGVGTAEELLYLLGILLHPENKDHPFPLILSGPAESEDYFQVINAFIGRTLGDAARSRYQIIINDPAAVARAMKHAMQEVQDFRRQKRDAFYYNWLLKVEHAFQQPFHPTHAAMASLCLSRDLPAHELAANLRRAFSGIVAGNVKEDGILAVETHGPFKLHGEAEILDALDKLLRAFVAQQRMKLKGEYTPCYQLVI